jgi:nitric oxide reductase subunit C
MLSKSQARVFFLVGTGVTATVFLGLTVDTFRRIPAQTNAAGITEQVVRGKQLWEANNCMGCHTILGEGAYYAPELTKVYARRGPDFIRAMLRDPEAMYPGQRRMVQYHFTPEQSEDLVAFLKWVGTILMPLAVPAGPALAAVGDRPQIFNQMCIACHSLGGQGGTIGPPLDGIGSRRDAEYIRSWLHDPRALKADAKMPKLPLSDGQIDELVAFLSTQKGS